MAYAKDHGIWPRPLPTTAAAAASSQAEMVYADPSIPSSGHLAEATAVPPFVDSTLTSVTASPGPICISAEGVLREALIRLWEQARAKRIEKIGLLSIRMFDATDAFRLLGVVAAVRGADRKRVSITGEYETTGGSIVGVTFEGIPQDAPPLKDFLEPQLRAAADKDIKARFDLGFSEGLSVESEAVDRLTEQLTRFATGAAYVEATAEAKP